MKKTTRRILLVALFLLVAIQFIRPEKSNPETPAEQDFSEVNNLSSSDAELLRSACYDCHSNQVEFPWYSNVAPVSFIVAHHVEEGREHLNFSEWSTYSERKADHKLEECAEEVEEGEMPMYGYTLFHSEADLTEEQKNRLVEIFESLRI